MFKSSRTEGKYSHFIVVDKEGNGVEIDEKILLDHTIYEGILTLAFEGDDYIAKKEWDTIDYGYNKPN